MSEYQNQCTECGHLMTVAKRIYKGGRYCPKCYKRWFVIKKCTQCHMEMRAYRYDELPVCAACQRLVRRCLRCNRLTPKAALMVGEMAVCSGCVSHFKEARPCPQCGKETSRLARSTELEFDEPVCDKCRQAHFKTCSVCRKYRKVHVADEKEKPICKACSESRGAPHPCPECGDLTQGLEHSICEGCQIRRRLKKRLRLHIERLETEEARRLLKDFHQWFALHFISPAACGRFDRYVEFFEIVDRHIFQQGLELTAEQLIAVCVGEQLRKATTPLKFLYEHEGIVIDTPSVEKAQDEKYIEQVFSDARISGFENILISFHLWLHNRNPNISSRTIRTYLRSSLTFLQKANVKGIDDLTQERVSHVLGRSKGLRASVSVFLTYLKKKHKLILSAPKPNRTPVTKLESALLDSVSSIMKRLESVEIGLSERKALTAYVLSKLYGLPLNQVLQIRIGQFGDGKMTVNGEIILLDNRIRQIVDTLITTTGKHQPLLFAGRRPGSSMNAASVKYWIRIEKT